MGAAAMRANANALENIFTIWRITACLCKKISEASKPRSQIRRVERLWKKIVHPQRFCFAIQIRENHWDIAAKLPDQLAARTAGRRQRIRIGDDGDSVKIALALAHGFENRDALGANRQTIGRVFDVAAAKNSAR